MHRVLLTDIYNRKWLILEDPCDYKGFEGTCDIVGLLLPEWNKEPTGLWRVVWCFIGLVMCYVVAWWYAFSGLVIVPRSRTQWKYTCPLFAVNYQVTHPSLVRLSKNVLEVLHDDIANLARYRKCIFLIWDPNIDWFPVGPFGLTFVKNDWWGVWPSCQMMKKCCWWIWASKSGEKLRPKTPKPHDDSRLSIDTKYL